MLKFLIFFLALIAIGIGLTLSLPKYKVESGNPAAKHQYTMDVDTLKTPLPMSRYFLRGPTPPDALFALRLGLYSKVQQATQYAESLSLDTPVIVVKAMDTHRDWYMVFLGPFDTIEAAEEKKDGLQKRQISATLMIWPPKPEKDE
ncbi:hypothetical protein tinsulaeT_36990 [Thalassotalea insulae]|uniref:SPOR domain-containing protein n=1 Tax=Thalassotalea insulae TaxID=2056778 RepID=A0ABQ6GYF4_9GAMM|nr:SPOR domain-containing protein [Thalassotalea insulae]GLX80359.1 hypothetical protein tinsulaeT_36990 [Thalassotalea insulae]